MSYVNRVIGDRYWRLPYYNRTENYNRETQSLVEGVKSYYFTVKFAIKVINLLWSGRIFPAPSIPIPLSVPIQMNG